MAKKKKSMFGGRTSRSMERPKNNYGYLQIPDDLNVFKPEGKTEVVFDILPYQVTDANHMDNKKYEDDAVVGDLWWKRPLKVHRNVGPEEISIVCPTTFGKPCPICEHGVRRKKEGADWDEELKEIFPKTRTLFLIRAIDMSECDADYPEGDLFLFDVSDHLFMEALEEAIKRDVDYEEFPNPYEGYSLQVYFRERKFGKTKFAEASKVEFIEREEQYDESFVEELPNLDEMLKVLSYKEIEAIYHGMEGLDDEDVDDEELEEEAPPPRRERKPRTNRTRTRKEPEPEEEPEDEPEPEKEKKPRTHTRSRSTKKDKCPHGHKFGVDTDDYDECAKCDVWEDCMDQKEENEKDE